MDLADIITVLLDEPDPFNFYQHYCDRVGTVTVKQCTDHLAIIGDYNAKSDGVVLSVLYDLSAPLEVRYKHLWANTEYTRDYIGALLEAALFISMLTTDMSVATSVDLFVFGEKRPIVRYLSANGSTTLLINHNHPSARLHDKLLACSAIPGFLRAVPAGDYLLGKPAIWVVKHPELDQLPEF